MSGKCKFCGAEVDKSITGWWNKNNCEDPVCVEKKRLEIKDKNRLKVRKKNKKVSAVKPVLQPLNGRVCQDCGQRLRGPWRMYCPEHYHQRVRLLGRMDGDHKFHNHEAEGWQWMRMTRG